MGSELRGNGLELVGLRDWPLSSLSKWNFADSCILDIAEVALDHSYLPD